MSIPVGPAYAARVQTLYVNKDIAGSRAAHPRIPPSSSSLGSCIAQGDDICSGEQGERSGRNKKGWKMYLYLELYICRIA